MDALRVIGNSLRGRQTRLETEILGTPLVLSVSALRELRRARSIAEEAALVERMLQFLRKDDIVYDIGANIGIIGLILARHPRGTRSQVHCFEPEPRNFEQLAGNVATNGLADRVSPHQVALGEREGEVELFVRGGPGEGRHSTAAREGSTGSVVVTMHTASAFARAVRAAPDVVKIDVEGAEGRVLAGMERLLREHPPREVFLELHAKGDGDRMPDGTAIAEWLSGFGYAAVWTSERGKTGHAHFRRTPAATETA